MPRNSPTRKPPKLAEGNLASTQASLAGLLEQTARHLHALGHRDGLVPAQWAALRYFSQSSAPHNTAIALARYQGLAFGPVSRTVRTLITKGLLRKAGSAGPGRAEAVEPTADGRALLAHDPLLLVEATLAALSEKENTCVALALTSVVNAISARERG